MAESVTVEHGGVEITTNTMSEADLRTEMEAPATPDPVNATPLEPPPSETPAQAAQRARDEKGRFAAKTEAAAPAAEPVAEPAAEPPARRRDDALPRHNPIARMQQALAQKAEAERKAGALEAEVQRYQELMARLQLPKPGDGHVPTAGEPQFEQFQDQPDPYTAYLQAWTRWDNKQLMAETRAQWDAEQTEKQRAQSFQSRLAAGKPQYPDFDQVLTQADTLGLQVSAVMQEAIADSPKAADLVYYLATHPEECLQLAEESVQTPVTAAPVMRRLLESHLAPRAAAPPVGSGAAARAPVSTAKPPVTPVGSSPVVSDEPPGDSASAAEHARYWNRRLKVPGTK